MSSCFCNGIPLYDEYQATFRQATSSNYYELWSGWVFRVECFRFWRNVKVVFMGVWRLAGEREILDVRFQILDFRFQIFNFKFQVIGYRFQISDFRFQVSGFKFQVSNFRFHVAGCWLFRVKFNLELVNYWLLAVSIWLTVYCLKLRAEEREIWWGGDIRFQILDFRFLISNFRL